MSDKQEVLAFIELLKEVKTDKNIRASKLAKVIGVHSSSIYNWFKEPPKTLPLHTKVEEYVEKLQNYLEGKDEVKYDVDSSTGLVTNIQNSDVEKLLHVLLEKKDTVLKEIQELKNRLEQLEKKEVRYSNAVDALRELEE